MLMMDFQVPISKFMANQYPLILIELCECVFRVNVEIVVIEYSYEPNKKFKDVNGLFMAVERKKSN